MSYSIIILDKDIFTLWFASCSGKFKLSKESIDLDNTVQWGRNV